MSRSCRDWCKRSAAFVAIGLILTLLTQWLCIRFVMLSECDVRTATVARHGDIECHSRYAERFGAQRLTVVMRPMSAHAPLATIPSSELLPQHVQKILLEVGTLHTGDILTISRDTRGFPFAASFGEVVQLSSIDQQEHEWLWHCYTMPIESDVPLFAIDQDRRIVGTGMRPLCLIGNVAFWAIVSAVCGMSAAQLTRRVRQMTPRFVMRVVGLCLCLGIATSVCIAVFCYGFAFVGSFMSATSARWAEATMQTNVRWQVFAVQDAWGEHYLSMWQSRVGSDSFMSAPPTCTIVEVLPSWGKSLYPVGTAGTTAGFVWGWPLPFLLALTTVPNSYQMDECLGRWVCPSRLLWTPFAFNVLCFALAWLLICVGVFGPRCVRRTLRLRQGACVECGYPRVTSTPCPECGHLERDAKS